MSSSRSRPVEPACPVNYFCRGVNYQLPADEKSALWFDEQWQIWEKAHPNDATGELAWAEYAQALLQWEEEQRVANTKLIDPPLESIVQFKVFGEPLAISKDAGKPGGGAGKDLLPNKRKGKVKPPLPTVELPPTLVAQWMVECIEEERQRRIRSVQGQITNHNPHQVRLTVDKPVYELFYKYCKKNGISMSSIIEKFMRLLQ